jgi:hypothetical protein
MKSDRILRLSLLVQLSLLAACSQKPAEQAASDSAPAAEAVKPLMDTELKGIDRDKVVLTMPWSDGPVSHDPDANALKASLVSIELSGGESYDRALLEFDEHMNLPGYRVAWNDTMPRSCRDPKTPAGSHLLFIELEPATAKSRKGSSTITPAGGLPAINRARQLCDDDSHVTWAIEADSAQVRVTELRNPPRLVVDVGHKAADQPATPPAEAPPQVR